MDSDPYRGLEPARLWAHFAALNAIPRPSGHEDRARDYVVEVAEAAGVPAQVDECGNTVVRVPASDGGRGPVVAVQAHLDMVCDAEPNRPHDCEADPIRARRDGDRISASGTTLGADNGIGVAAALSLIAAPDVRHGPLELIFTVDEESGRWSALELDMSSLAAEMLINLDSEDSEAVTVGSAGGGDVELTLPVGRECPWPGSDGVVLRLSGLGGGHSGLQIDEPRANGIKLLVEALERLRSAGLDYRLASIDGGSATNAIPRGAVAVLEIPAGELALARRLVGEGLDELRTSWAATEHGMRLELGAAQAPASLLVEDAATRLLDLLRRLPHGVLARSERFPDTVETSANLAVVETGPAVVRVLTSVRSFSDAGLRAVQAGIGELADDIGASREVTDGYPLWEPLAQSRLVDAAVAAYRRTYGREPRINVLHAGLECGAFVRRRPGLEAVSFGPRIGDAHTPKEHVYASTVESTWQLLVGLLGDLCD